MEGITVGFAFCGSFCTLEQAVRQLEKLSENGMNIIPIMSETTYATDTRFGAAKDFIDRIEGCCGKKIIHTIKDAEPIGPKKLLDALIIAPCTGNTIGKLALGITDTAVTMATKAHLRNARPVLIAAATNDALGASAKNIGLLLNSKHLFFVPMRQDDPIHKPNSLISDFDKIPEALEAALAEKQLQPCLF